MKIPLLCAATLPAAILALAVVGSNRLAAAEPAPDVVEAKLKSAGDARDVIYKEKRERASLVFFKAEVEKFIAEYPTRPVPAPRATPLKPSSSPAKRPGRSK